MPPIILKCLMKIIKLKTTTNNNLYAQLFGLLVLFNSSSLYATEHGLFFEMPVVLSASRLEQSVSNAAVSISVIDHETIIASGARTIPEVLRLVPGMQVGYSGNMFGDEPRYVVTYHGHSGQYSRQMQVLIDGRSIYEPFLGGINWKSIPVNINDIERIEVSRGPNLATYGSNSFQAAINIITRTAAEDQGSFIQTNIGGNDIADLTYRYGGNTGKLDYRVTVSTFNDSGLDSANEYDYPDDTQSNNLDYRLDYQLDNKNTITYQGGYGSNHQQTDRNHNLEGNGNISPFPLARTVENTRAFQFLKWENVIDRKNTLLVQYYYNLSDKKDSTLTEPLFDPPPAPFDPVTLEIDGDTKSQRHNLELTHFIYPQDNLKLVWGLSGQMDSVKAPFYLGRDDAVSHNQFRGFGIVEWYVTQNNTINFGALVEENDVTDTELSPRLSFTHAFNKQHSIRLGVSRAIRSPFILETDLDTTLTLPLRINGQAPPPPFPDSADIQVWLGSVPGGYKLQNEKIISREIAYFGSFLNSAFLFNARLFHDDINDYIRLEGTEFRNNIDSTSTGLELEMDYHFDNTLRFSASGSIINISSNEAEIENSAPQHSFSFITSKRFNNKYNGSLAYYYVDAFAWTDSRGGTSEYDTLDMRLSRNIKLARASGSLSIVLKNILGDYSDYLENPGVDSMNAPKVVHSRHAYADLRLNF